MGRLINKWKCKLHYVLMFISCAMYPFARLEVEKKENPRKKLFEIGMDHASKNNSLHDPDLFSISKYQIFV